MSTKLAPDLPACRDGDRRADEKEAPSRSDRGIDRGRPGVHLLTTMFPDLRDTILNTWRTSNRLTVFLVERIPPELWVSAIPGAPRRTIRMMAGHIHNSRCQWIK